MDEQMFYCPFCQRDLVGIRDDELKGDLKMEELNLDLNKAMDKPFIEMSKNERDYVLKALVDAIGDGDVEYRRQCCNTLLNYDKKDFDVFQKIKTQVNTRYKACLRVVDVIELVINHGSQDLAQVE